MNNHSLIFIMMIMLLMASCHYEESEAIDTLAPLPVLSMRATPGDARIVRCSDSVDYAQTPAFTLINQDSQIVEESMVRDKVFVVDFFFTSCPSICPLVSKQLQRVYRHMKGRHDFRILSHSIDTKHDTPPVLKRYAQKLRVTSDIWMFLTGDKSTIYDLANQGYRTTVYQDERQPGSEGLMHSGVLVLIDRSRLIRGLYDGKDAESVDRLIRDAQRLLEESARCGEVTVE